MHADDNTAHDALDDLITGQDTPPILELARESRLPTVAALPQVAVAIQMPEPVQQGVTPWWEAFTPPTDHEGHLILDPKQEFAAHLTYASLGDRLTKTGVTDLSLNVLLKLMQSTEVSPAVRADIAKYLSGLAGKAEQVAPSIQVIIDVPM